MPKSVDPEKYYQIYADYHIRGLSYKDIEEARGFSPGMIADALKWVDEKIKVLGQPELLKGAVESTRDRLKWLKEQARDSLKRVKTIQATEEGKDGRPLTEEEETKMRSYQNSYLRFNSAIGGVETHLHQLQGLLKGIVLMDEGAAKAIVAGFSEDFKELIDQAKKNADKKGD